MMKRLYLVFGLAGALGATTAHASLQATLLANSSQYSSLPGGEFRAVASADLVAATGNLQGYSSLTKGTISAANSSDWGYNAALNGSSFFQTFCIEYNEHFYPGTTYTAGISQKALYGGQNPGGDPISIGTAWLYSQFAAGTLTGYEYNYGSGRAGASEAGALQKAIWFLEQESNGADNDFVALARSILGKDNTQLQADANGAYGVRALNLGAPGLVQDQLVVVPVPETTTMIAGALLLLPFAASTLRILRRNRAGRREMNHN